MSSEAAHPSDSGGPSVQQRTDRVVGAADGLATQLQGVAREAFGFVRFLCFILYLIVSVVGFWLGLFAALLGAVRMIVRFAKALLLYVSGGHPPPPGGRAQRSADAARQELTRLWDARLLVYADVARPMARQYVATRVAMRRFWYWDIVRKLSTLLIAMMLVAVPLLYIVPRPNQVQITDDNAISHTDGQLRYLIHALDLSDPATHLEYENEYALFLGKVNPQGLKSQLQPGRYYRVWVVGIRWNYFPKTSYPNILWATEIDRNGAEITGTGLLAQPAATTPDK